MLVASLLLLTLLIGCGTSNRDDLQLPDIPPNLKNCANVEIPAIPGERGSPLTKEQAANSLGEQRASALSKDRCVKDTQAWILDLRKSLSK